MAGINITECNCIAAVVVQTGLQMKSLWPLPGRWGGGSWGGGRLLVSLVPMLEQKKNDQKGYFFKLCSAQRCHRLGSEKFAFLWEKIE